MRKEKETLSKEEWKYRYGKKDNREDKGNGESRRREERRGEE